MTPPKNNRRAKFEFPYVATASNLLLQTQDLVIGYDHALVKSAFNFSVGGDEKVAITGFNGIGKTTLLKTLLESLAKAFIVKSEPFAIFGEPGGMQLGVRFMLMRLSNDSTNSR